MTTASRVARATPGGSGASAERAGGGQSKSAATSTRAWPILLLSLAIRLTRVLSVAVCVLAGVCSCKSRPYHDDDEPPKHIRLPVRWLDPPVSLQILAAIFLVTFTSALLTIAKNRRRLESERQQDEAEAERRRSTSIQAASARPPMPTSGGLHRSVRSLN